MKVYSGIALLCATFAISPASAALRATGNGNGSGKGNSDGLFDNTNEDKDNGNGNGKDKGYNDMVNDIFISLDNGESLSEAKVKQLKNKYKQDKLKINSKKKMFKDSAVNVLEKNKNQIKGKNVTELELVMETLAEIPDLELHYDLLANVEDGYAEPEDPDTVEPRAGELEDMDDFDDEEGDGRRRLGVPTTRNRWANGVVRYKIVYEYSYSGFWMWATRVLPAMVELESLTNLEFEYAGGVWTSGSARADGTVYLRVRTSGCSAHIGAPSYGSVHYINIGPNCGHGSILHELLHTSGMHHQQVAQYRDRYVTVNFGNIQDGRAGNFYKKYNHGLEFLYDYGSIMHYGQYGFSKNGGKTIDCRGRSCGQRGGLSYWDMWEIIFYYYGFYFVNGGL